MARETPSPHPSWLMPLIILNPSLKLTTRTLSLRSPRTWRWKPLSKRETIMLQLTTYRYQRFYSTVPPSASSSWWNNVSFMNNWSQCFSVSYYEIYFEQSSSWAVWRVELLVCLAVEQSSSSLSTTSLSRLHTFPLSSTPLPWSRSCRANWSWFPTSNLLNTCLLDISQKKPVSEFSCPW